MRHSEESPQSDDVIVDGFDHLEPIGRGGFSRVYRATQTALGRLVAIKLLEGDLDSAAKQKAFERECRAMGTLSQHPNIVTVFSAAYSTTGRPCIVMEYYEAGTLGDEIKLNGPLPHDEVVGLGIKLCDALAAAHSAGIVHRDIKPQNLFRSTYSDVVLGDFGISSFAEDHTATRAGGGLTIHYAAPELIDGGNASAQSDVYSLAATLYYLVSGDRPFPRSEGESMTDVARRILVQTPPRFDSGGPGAALGDLLAAAMAKNPGDRPRSAPELRRHLEKLGDEPAIDVTVADEATDKDEDEETTADSPVPLAPASTLSRRNRSLAVGAAAIVGFVAVLGLAAMNRSAAAPPTASQTTDRANDDTFYGAPATPRNLVGTIVDGQFAITWDAVDGATRYEVEHRDAARSTETTKSTTATLELSPDAPTCVVVRSVSAAGLLSVDSAEVCAS